MVFRKRGDPIPTLLLLEIAMNRVNLVRGIEYGMRMEIWPTSLADA